MLELYKKIAVVSFCLAIWTLLTAIICFQRFFVSDALFPASESVVPWQLKTLTDVKAGGSSTNITYDATTALEYEYFLGGDKKYPYVMQVLSFSEFSLDQSHVNLSAYESVSFKVRCTPSNGLRFYVNTYDEKVTDPLEYFSYRIAAAPFSCGDGWTKVKINLHSLKVPTWWLEIQNLAVSDQDYSLDQVFAFTFDSNQGPRNTAAKIKIIDLQLQRREWVYVYVFLILMFISWIGFFVWLIKVYTSSLISEVKQKFNKNRPFIAYQQLSVNPHKNKEKNSLLHFLATEFTNPDLSMNDAVEALGINRTKVNAILRAELGLTFIAYLNKLRLTEAVRKFSQGEDACVADVAFSVGYNDVSYFIRLFKSEYKCTPKKFKSLYLERKTQQLNNA